MNLLDKFINGRKSSLPECMILCAAASLAGTFYCSEHFYGETVRTAVCLVLTAITAAVWLICAACCGRDGKYGFTIFAFLYHSVPFFYTLWYSGRDNLHDYNKWLAMCNKAAKALLLDPFLELSERLGCETVMIPAILLTAVMAAYTAAFLIKRSYDSKNTVHKNENDEQAEIYLTKEKR
ncbi:MAG: hypothetical protein IJT87_10545 [Ruminiclostridium sp.]|nr:hypothetical protein [Ruminiclostridium sp.]